MLAKMAKDKKVMTADSTDWEVVEKSAKKETKKCYTFLNNVSVTEGNVHYPKWSKQKFTDEQATVFGRNVILTCKYSKGKKLWVDCWC
jgi:hypothetical protein